MSSEQLRQLVESGVLDKLIIGFLDQAYCTERYRTKEELLRESGEYQKKILDLLERKDRG
jgi:hypothetical protein